MAEVCVTDDEDEDDEWSALGDGLLLLLGHRAAGLSRQQWSDVAMSVGFEL
jgi:hypothetical protein